MSRMYEKEILVFKAFSDENRLMALMLLQNGEQCAHDLLEKMGIGQSTLSHHMKILCNSGIVDSRRDGKWTYYSISPEGSKHAANLLYSFTCLAVPE